MALKVYFPSLFTVEAEEVLSYSKKILFSLCNFYITKLMARLLR